MKDMMGCRLKLRARNSSPASAKSNFLRRDYFQKIFGYALVEGEKSLTEVVREIKKRVTQVGSINSFYQQNLFSIKRDRILVEDIVIFKA